VGSEFGFPRVDIRKRYRWKKMNFTTDLPKRRPYVTYIVASAVKCEKFFPNSKNEGPSYRMHAVILNKNGMQSQRYKLKYRGSLGSESLESNANSTNSTNCPSLAEEHERFDASEDVVDGKERNTKHAEKSYILCHIRKIDSNYKMSKKRKPLQSSDELFEETLNRVKEAHSLKKIHTSSISKEDKSGFIRHNNIHSHPKEERKINFPMMNYYLNAMNDAKKPEQDIKKKEIIPKPLVSNTSINIDQETDKMPAKSIRPVLGNKILSKSNGTVENSKPHSFGQFHLDELLHHELKRYDNENYDYFKIFNVLINHKYK